jgi:hypothetical protein
VCLHYTSLPMTDSIPRTAEPVGVGDLRCGFGGGVPTYLEQLRRRPASRPAIPAPGASGRAAGTSRSAAAYQPTTQAAAAAVRRHRLRRAGHIQAGATTRAVGERFGLAHSSVNKLLRPHGVVARRRSPSPQGIQQAVELYEAGLSTRVIAEHLGFGASTILRGLARVGIAIRPRFCR